MKCPQCKGLGKRTEFYTEVLDATGLFYDQNMVRDLRMITAKCRECKGTGEVDKGERSLTNGPLDKVAVDGNHVHTH